MLNKNKKYRWLSGIIGIFIFTIYMISTAYGNDEKPTAEEVPTGTLIIGTHLIHINGLVNEILEVALDSVQGEDYDQSNIYYKSEFAEGNWCDTTDSDSIFDITSASTGIVSNKIIDTLIQDVLTHWTKEDGTTIEFATGQSVAVHDIESLSNPENMEELKEIDAQIDILQSKKDTTDDDDLEKEYEENGNILEAIMEPVDTDDEALDLLDMIVDNLRNEEGSQDDEINVVLEAKEQVKLKYDMACYEEVNSRLQEAVNEMDSKDNSALVTSLATALQDVNDKILELENELRGDPVSEIESLYNEREDNMVELSEDDLEEVKKIVEELVALNHIGSGIVSNEELQNELLDEAGTNAMNNLLESLDDDDDYAQALEDGESQSVIDGIIDDMLETINDNLEEVKAINEYKEEVSDTPLSVEQTLLDDLEEMTNSLEDNPIKEEIENLFEPVLDELEASIVDKEVEDSSQYQDALTIKEQQEEKYDRLNEAFLMAVEEGDMDQAEEYSEALKEVEEEIQADQNSTIESYISNNKQYDAIEEEKEILEEQLQEIEDSDTTDGSDINNEEKQSLSEEIQQLEEKLETLAFDIALDKKLMDDKNSLLIDIKDDAIESFKEAIEDVDTSTASSALDELLDVMDVLSEDLLNDENKIELLEDLESTLSDAYIDQVKDGQFATADELKDIEDEIKNELEKISENKQDDNNEVTEAGEDSQQDNEVEPKDKDNGINQDSTTGQDNGTNQDSTTGQDNDINQDSKTEQDDSTIDQQEEEFNNDFVQNLLNSGCHIIFIEENIGLKNNLIIEENMVMLPVQDVFKTLQNKIIENYSGTVAVQNKKYVIEFIENSNIIYFNDKRNYIEIATVLQNNSLYAVMDDIFEMLGYSYIYSETYDCVLIDTNP